MKHIEREEKEREEREKKKTRVRMSRWLGITQNEEVRSVLPKQLDILI